MVAANAQSADVITEILESDEVTFGQVCYLSAVQQNLMNEDSTFSDAVQVLYENGQIPELYSESLSVPVIDVAYIFSYMWNIKGSLMLKLTKGSPRYVFKQLQSDGIIASSVQPKSYISGAQTLSLYTACLRKYGDFDITKVTMGDE